MSVQRFQTLLNRSADNRILLDIPFDPNETWGVKEKHHITGSFGGHPIRGCLESRGGQYSLALGPSWGREFEGDEGESFEVVISPEGPQLGDLSPDVIAALDSDPVARAFFESLATFYRNGFIRGIEDARRPETRNRRITEMMASLKAGKKQR